MESSLINVGNVVALRRKPVLVMEKPVYELNATRRKIQVATREDYSGERCQSGIFSLQGTPNKPAA